MSDNHTDRLLNFVLPRGTVEHPTIVAEGDIITFSTVGIAGAPGGGATSSRYKSTPEKVLQLDYELFQSITSTIPDTSTQRELEATHVGSGCRVLAAFTATIASNAAVDDQGLGAKILEDVAEHEGLGISAPTVAAFNVFKSTLIDICSTLPTDLEVKDPMMATKLGSAVRALGRSIRGPFNNQLQLTGARGNLKKTIDAAVTILSQ